MIATIAEVSRLLVDLVRVTMGRHKVFDDSMSMSTRYATRSGPVEVNTSNGRRDRERH